MPEDFDATEEEREQSNTGLEKASEQSALGTEKGAYSCPRNRHEVTLEQDTEETEDQPHLRLSDDRQNALYHATEESLGLDLQVLDFSSFVESI